MNEIQSNYRDSIYAARGNQRRLARLQIHLALCDIKPRWKDEAYTRPCFQFLGDAESRWCR